MRDTSKLPLPPPLHGLYRKAQDATIGLERHRTAVALIEGCLRIAVVARLNAWWEVRPDRPHLLDGVIVRLPQQSLRPWLEALSMLEDLEGVPGSLRRLRTSSPSQAPLQALRRGAASHADISRALPTPGEDTLSALALLVAYHEAVGGRGDWYPDTFHQRMAPLVLNAVLALLEDGALLGRGHITIRGRATETTPEAAVELSLPDARVLLWPWVQIRRDLGSTGLGVEVDWESRERWTVREAELKGGPLDIGWTDAVDLHDAKGGWRVLALRLQDPVRQLAWRDEDPMALGFVQDLLVRAREGAKGLDGEPMPSLPLEHGFGRQRQLGDYLLQERLGRGATGSVYRARQVTDDRLVAIKVLASDLEDDDIARERFRREAEALSRASHPAIVEVIDWGQCDGRAWLVMEFVEGIDVSVLFRVLGPWQRDGAEHLVEEHLVHAAQVPRGREVGPPPPLSGSRSLHQGLAEHFANVADGLQHLHELGILHRDVKAANLRLTDDGGRLVLLDFGLARLSDQSHSLTGSDHVVGTLRYMPPEQLCREELDGRVDVYALGVTLWELVSGNRFFNGRTEERLVHQVLNEEPPPLAQLAPWVDRDLARILRRATAKDRRHRYPSAGELARDLRRYAAGQSVRVPRPSLDRRLGRLVREQGPLLALGLLAGGVFGAGAWWWDQGRTKVSWVATLEERDGAYVPGAPLFEGAADALRVETVGGRVQRVRWSPALRPDLSAARQAAPATSLEVDHDAQGRPSRVRWLDPVGATVRSVTLERPEPGVVLRRHLDRLGVPSPTAPGEPFTERLTLDEQGRVVETRWLDVTGLVPVPDGQGWFGTRTRYDAQGRVVEVIGLDAMGEPALARSGVASHAFRYEGAGRAPSRMTWRGLDGSAVSGPLGAVHLDLVRDAWGRVVEQTALDAEQKPMRPSAARGAELETPAFPELSLGCAVVRSSYDEVGRPTGQHCLDETGEPTFSALGLAGWRVAYAGDDATWTWLDRSDEPVRVDGWWAGVALSGSPWGTVSRFTLLDRSGLTALGEEAWAQLSVERDEHGAPVALRWMDERGVRSNQHQGYAEEDLSWSPSGLMTAASWQGASGQPALGPAGAHQLRYSHDPQGHLVEVRAHGLDGGLAWQHGAPPITRYRRTVTGLATEEAWFGTDEAPVSSPRGFHRVVTSYDDRGLEVAVKAFGTNGRPVAAFDGVAEVRRVRDSFGEEVQVTYPDESGRLAADVHGHARMLRHRDAQGREVRREHFDVSGQPVSVHGAFATEYRYDALGRVVEHALFGVDGEPVQHGGPEGEWYHRFVFTFDARGNELTRSAYGIDGRLSDRGNYAVQRSVYDHQGNLVRMDFLGADEQPELLPGWGCASIVHAHDPHNQVVETRYLGVAGELLTVEGSAIARYRYDEQGRFSSEAFFAADGEPALGRPLEWADMDVDPELPAPTARYHRREFRWSAGGALVEQALYGVDAAPMVDEFGVHRLTIERDARGLELQRYYLGIDGRPATGPGGVSRLVTRRDPAGTVLEVERLDAAGLPVEG